MAVEAPITPGLAGLSATGLVLVQHKHTTTEAALASLNRNTIFKIGRFSAGWYSDHAQVTRDAFCYGKLALVSRVCECSGLHFKG